MTGVAILAGYSTDMAKQRFEKIAHEHGYHVEEWLVPSATGGLRILATTNEDQHSLGFKWDGDDMNVLVTRLMSLDVAMCRSRDLIAQGSIRPNRLVVQ